MEATEQTAATDAAAEKSKLRRALGLTDLVLFYIAAIVGLRWVATASKVGPSAVVVWALAFLFFFIPLALTVIELSSRYPEEGGIYVWSKKAFGDFHGFMTGWTYWVSQIVYFPGLLFFAASNAASIIPGQTDLATNKIYLAIFSVCGLALALILNMVGLKIGKWMPNTSGTLGTWVPAAFLIVMGIIAWLRFGPANDFSAGNLAPRVGSIYDIVFWSNIAFAFGGLEAASLMSEEVRDAKRNIPRAVVIAGVMITFIYIAGTVCLLLALPQDQTSGLSGIIDAIKVTAGRVGGEVVAARVGSLVAFLMALGYIGGVGAWMAATARLPFVAGIDRYLPPAFGRLHSRWGTPYVALSVQAGITVLFIILAELAGKRAEQAYEILVSLGIIAYFIPYLYLFASLIVLKREPAREDVIRIGGGRFGGYLVGGLGFVVTAVSIVLACVPSGDVEDKTRFLATVLGTMAIAVIIGIVIYLLGKRRKRRSEAISRFRSDI